MLDLDALAKQHGRLFLKRETAARNKKEARRNLLYFPVNDRIENWQLLRAETLLSQLQHCNTLDEVKAMLKKR